jgi:succinate dehydrogenase/fumarate reductase flavoprotein subunit
VRLATGARVTGLETTGPGGGVRGAEITRDDDGTADRVACHAAILATGGFEWHGARRERHIPVPLRAFGGPPTNEGDALALAESAGAALEALEHAWMMPMVQIPGETLGGRPFYRSLVTERGIPRSILVNAAGARFVSEALPYNELVRAFHRRDRAGGFPNARAWLVFDEAFRRRYSILQVRPGEPLPDWVASGATPGELAQRTGIDAEGLGASIVLWNAMCRHAGDELYARGESPYESYYGDPALLPENPTLGPLDEPPFHAFEVLPGTIGTKGGPRTDPDGRVLRPDGGAIDGLYAAGNAAAGWLADAYPAPGATLGVAMTFGFRAGRHAGDRAAARG